MYLHVITEDKTPFLRHGLTYYSANDIPPGTIVRVPLRASMRTGIVLATSIEKPGGDIDIKSVHEVIGEHPVLHPYQLQALPWFCEYYCCTPRHALQAFLPEPPWSLIAEKKVRRYTLIKDEHVPGRKQAAMIALLRKRGPMEEEELRKELLDCMKTIPSLLKRGIVEETVVSDREIEAEHRVLPFDKRMEDVEVILAHDRPTLLIDKASLTERLSLYIAMAQKTWNSRRSTLLIFPSIMQAEEAYERIRASCEGATVEIVHSNISATQRRASMRRVRRKPAIVVGTRTALFMPLLNPGLLLLDNEHEWSWKSEQTPRYHARLVAEVLAKHAKAALILASPTPSLDSLKHAIIESKGRQQRYVLYERSLPRKRCTVDVIDLTEAKFGTIYPFTSPLIQAIKDNIEMHGTSVLLLNKRGTGSSLLCFECRRPLQSSEGVVPLAVITRNGKQWLLDRSTGETQPTPSLCPHCGSANLRIVGAGTERVEEIVRNLFPEARIVRIDGDSVNTPKTMREVRRALDEGKIDIILGTQSVIPSLTSHRVTLAAMLIADIGLSIPDFRAGERVFQMISSIIHTMHDHGKVIVQTFRKNAPEIKAAIEGTSLTYLREELAQREVAGFPPASQLIDLIVRNDRIKATQLKERLEATAHVHGCTITLREDRTSTAFLWIIRIRGKRSRDMLKLIPLAGIIIDVDPME